MPEFEFSSHTRMMLQERDIAEDVYPNCVVTAFFDRRLGRK